LWGWDWAIDEQHKAGIQYVTPADKATKVGGHVAVVAKILELIDRLECGDAA